MVVLLNSDYKTSIKYRLLHVGKADRHNQAIVKLNTSAK